MAKARTKASVKDRALQAWYKTHGTDPAKVYEVACTKSRSKDTITVREADGSNPLTWSYKGGSLRRLSPSQAAGVKGLSACISGEYA